jgi:hypothetical protein
MADSEWLLQYRRHNALNGKSSRACRREAPYRTLVVIIVRWLVIDTTRRSLSFIKAFDLVYSHLCLLLIRINSIRPPIKAMSRSTLGKYFPRPVGVWYLSRFYRLFIGGQWVDPVEGGTIESVLLSSSTYILLTFPKCH